MNPPYPDLSQAAKIIGSFEGFRANPYHDQVGIATIGYGTIRYPDGTRVTMDDPAVTEEQAQEYLAHALKDFAVTLWRHLKREPTPNQWAAMLSIMYNVGATAIIDSTLLREFNACHISEAAGQFLRWNKVRINGKLVSSKGLSNRREKERELFLKSEEQNNANS